MASTVSVLPRFCGSVTSVIHALKAASFAVEPKKGHDAIHNHNKHTCQHYGICRWKQHAGVMYGNQGKRKGSKAPDDIARTDKDFPLADLIGERSHKKGCQSSGDCAECHHRGNHGRVACNRIVNIYIEIHVFDCPCQLAEQTEHDQRGPTRGLSLDGFIFSPQNSKIFMQNNIVIVTEAIHKVNRRKRLLQRGFRQMALQKKTKKM